MGYHPRPLTFEAANEKALALAMAMDRQRLEGLPVGSSYRRQEVLGEFPDAFSADEPRQVVVRVVAPGVRLRGALQP